MSSNKSVLVALTEDQINLLLWLCKELLHRDRTWLQVSQSSEKNLASVVGQLEIASYALKQEDDGGNIHPR